MERGVARHRFSVGRFSTYLFMVLLAAFSLLPLVYMVVTAFKPLEELFRYPPQFFVRRPTMKNFSDLLTTMDSQSVPFSRYIFNSVFTTVFIVLLTVAVCSMGAYIVSRVQPKGSAVISRAVVLALMFSTPSAQIPIYLSMVKLHMLDTYFALILPYIATPMYFFLFNQFMSQIPMPLIEAARIDGAGVFRTYIKIVLPMVKPAVAAVVVFSFVNSWNNSGSSMIYITSQNMKTLPFVLSSIANGTLSRAGAAAAASLLTTLPTIIIYLAMQSKVMDAMGYAGIKG